MYITYIHFKKDILFKQLMYSTFPKAKVVMFKIKSWWRASCVGCYIHTKSG